jgi:endogenous inhibitor of DNA gyrase (YacG/DUF329 family)
MSRYKPKARPTRFCEECGEPFKQYRPQQRFCSDRKKNCRWKHWQREHPTVRLKPGEVEQPATVNVGKALAAIRWKKERDGTVKSRKRKTP